MTATPTYPPYSGHDRGDGSDDDVRSGGVRIGRWTFARISGIWTLTALVAALAVIGLASMFLHGAAAAACLLLGVVVTLALVPVAVAVEHARGHDDVP